MTACRRCTELLLHCHGTLVRHGDGTVECTEPECGGDAAMHEFAVSCEEVQATCCAGILGSGFGDQRLTG